MPKPSAVTPGDLSATHAALMNARLAAAALTAISACARPPEPVPCGPECDEYKVCNERGRLWKTPFTFPLHELHGGRYVRPTYKGGDVFVVTEGDTAVYLDTLEPYFESGTLTMYDLTRYDKSRVVIPPHACFVEQAFYGSRSPEEGWSFRVGPYSEDVLR